MKKPTINLAIVSALSLTLLGGMTAYAAFDSRDSISQHPSAVQKSDQPDKPGKRSEEPAFRRNKPAEPGQAPPPRREGSSVEKRQERLMPPKTGARSDVTTTVNPENGISVVISGGFDTDPVDRGRPVVLIAAALGVPTEVFREAFSGVTPAGAGGDGPSSELAQRNKAALLKVLAPYGITNERLDEVSNYYRYSGVKGEVWSRSLATATAIVTDGIVTGVNITNAGAGYTSNPTITIIGPNGKMTATATLTYTNDFSTNGSISAIAVP